MRGRGFLWLVALGCVLAPVVRIAVRAYRAERQSFIASPHAPQKSLAQYAIADLRAVSFRSRLGYTLRGFYAPSKNGAAVVLLHGACGERSDVSAETELLSHAGFGVLAFDWPGHGESEGEIKWGEPERSALVSALDWLEQQPSIDRSRLGAYGFSMGGYTLTQVAATDLRLKAVALAGTPHDPTEQTRWEYRRYGIVARWPAFLAIRRAGMDLAAQIPERVIASIAPRAVLIISGTEDPIVPPWMAQRLLQAARAPKQLLRVPGAGHGGYSSAATNYERELVLFFERALSA